MALMMRAAFTSQALFFAAFGLFSGVAISEMVRHEVAEAESQTVAALILDIPMDRLGNISTE